MKAIVQRTYGSHEVLRLEDMEKPSIGSDEVLIRVRASSINHADVVYVTGRPLVSRLAFGLKMPRETVRGKDVAGVVEAVGSNVARLKPGNHVYGELVAGAFAEYVAAPADRLALMPASLTFPQAATVPLAGMTALQRVRDAGGLAAGQRILINGASGGVGSFAVQVAVALGGEVTAVASQRSAELVASLGARHVIDYARADFTGQAAKYDVILDLVGNHTLSALRGVLHPKGTLVLSSGAGGSVMGPMGRMLRAAVGSPFVSQTMALFRQRGSVATLNELTALIESGKVAPAVDRTYPLAQVASAVECFVKDHPQGKVAIEV